MRRVFSLYFLFSLFLLVPPGAPAEGDPFLVRDSSVIPTTADGLEDFGRVLVDGILFFRARHPRFGTELWRSDGTAEGTRLVADLCRGSCSSDPRPLVAAGGRLYFFAADGVFGRELWTSDGTGDGTRLVRDLCPGACGSDGGLRGPMAALGDGVLFAADDGRSGLELWQSDGSRAGTVRVADLCEGACDSAPHDVWAGASRGYFQVLDADGAASLWVTDGTADGTAELLASCQLCIPQSVTGDELYFRRDFPPRGIEMWKSDGTPEGTVLLADACPGACDGYPREATAADGSIYFVANTGLAGPATLFRSDGTPSGTAPVLAEPDFFGLSRLAPTAGGLLFTTTSDLNRYVSVWKTDGTLLGTSEVIHRFRSRFNHFEMADASSRLFFVVLSAHQDRFSLFKKDSGHPVSLAGFPAGPNSPPTDLTPNGDRVFFSGDDGDSGKELWFSAGSTASTRMLADLDADPGSSFPRRLAALDDVVVFFADQDDAAPGLWRSDGTELGTSALGFGPTSTREIVRFGDRLVFSGASSQISERGLWTTDGTPQGTELLTAGLSAAHGFVESGGTLYFAGLNNGDAELWTADGTAAGTRQVADIRPWYFSLPIGFPEPLSSDPHDLVAVDGGILFGAASGEFTVDDELWRSDGTEAGTVRVRDICSGDCSSEPRGMVALGDLVLFAAGEPETGREPWRSDGTEAGTWRLADLRRGPQSSDPHGFSVLGERAVFFAEGAASRLSLDKQATLRRPRICPRLGQRLWVTDGTEGGTRRIHCLNAGNSGSWVTDSVVVGDQAFFVAVNETSGPELWVTDGTAAGTGLLADLRPGPAGSYPSALTAVDGVLVFAADDGDSGAEPWVSDGTAAGTRRLADVAIGPASSSPAEFTPAGDLLFFSAGVADSGRELWALPAPGSKLPLGKFISAVQRRDR